MNERQKINKTLVITHNNNESRIENKMQFYSENNFNRN